MAKQYIVQFGAGSPTLMTGLSPTFQIFKVVPGGGATTAPGITEIPTGTGLYYFSYSPLSSIAFLIDAGATVSGDARYLAGSLDPADAIDELGSTLVAIGTTTVALGTTTVAIGTSILAAGTTTGVVGTLIGSLADSFGSTLTDPTSVFGYLKRLMEFNEGNSVFTKSSGTWDIYSRGNTYVLGASTYPGSSTMLRSKLVEDDGSVITKG